MAEWFSATIGNLKKAKDSTDKIRGNDALDSGVKESVANIWEALLDLQSSLYLAKEENDKLARAVDTHENWKDLAQNYEITNTGGGSIVYFSSDPINHYACPRCFETKERHILQASLGRYNRHRCPKCEAEFQVDPPPSYPTQRVVSSGPSRRTR